MQFDPNAASLAFGDVQQLVCEALSGLDGVAQFGVSRGQIRRSLLHPLFQLVMRLAKSFLGPLNLGNVGRGPEPARDAPLRIVERLHLDENVESFLITASKPKFQTGGRRPPAHHLLERLMHGFKIFRRPINKWRLRAYQLLLAPADHVAETAIYVALPAL